MHLFSFPKGNSNSIAVHNFEHQQIETVNHIVCVCLYI